MTTEIAVLNQLGIALATDSAVTITGGGRVKVFNSADKLFELSANFPVAVMINGFAATDRKKPSKKILSDREKLIKDMAKVASEEYHDKAAEQIKEKFSREFDGMIAMMPKQELIELAEALVSITAIERKATVDEGTVGGPVDVALITKHEGFVWIKRKHHFPRDLNPRYFWRKFGVTPGSHT